MTGEQMLQHAAALVANRRSAAAARMRRHRERRRQGLHCLVVELRTTEIDALIRRGMLRREMRADDGAVLKALYDFLERSLGDGV